MEEVGTLVREEAVEHAADALDQDIDGSCRLVPEQRLELCEGHLDRVHIGAVGRQVEDLGAAVGDRFSDAGDLVGGQVVEHHDIAALEGALRVGVAPSTMREMIDATRHRGWNGRRRSR